MEDKHSDDKSYWYLYEYDECVLCGRHSETKRRIYDKPKPEDADERHKYTQYACPDHFI